MIISEGELKIADDLTRADVTVCLGGDKNTGTRQSNVQTTKIWGVTIMHTRMRIR